MELAMLEQPRREPVSQASQAVGDDAQHLRMAHFLEPADAFDVILHPLLAVDELVPKDSADKIALAVLASPSLDAVFKPLLDDRERTAKTAFFFS